MSYKQDIYVDKYGICYLEADGVTLPCCRISYSMIINQMHAVSVNVAIGTSITNPAQSYSEAAEDLMYKVQSHIVSGAENTAQRLIACSIYEEQLGMEQTEEEKRDNKPGTQAKKPILIFNGYIGAANIAYKAGVPTYKEIRFDCYGPSGLLQAFSMNAYVVANYGNIIERLRQHTRIDYDSALLTGASYQTQRTLIEQRLVKECMNKTVVERIAVCVDCIKHCATHKSAAEYWEDTKTKKLDGDVIAALGGTTKLARSEELKKADAAYSEYLFKSITMGVAHANLLTTIMYTICNDDCMLQLVPRWTVDKENDFKLEVTPVSVWATDKKIELSASDVLGININYSSTAALVQPDILIVSFSPGVYSYTCGGAGSQHLGIYGVACIDKDLQSRLRSLMASGAKSEDVHSMLKKYRVKELYAPGWLTLSVVSDGDTNGDAIGRGPSTKLQRNESTPQKVKDQVSSKKNGKPNDNDLSPSMKPNAGIQKTANIVAEALLYHHYMLYEKCTVMVNPGLRFGHDPKKFLENHLGYPVIIDITGDGVAKSKINITGELHGISYEAAYGNTSSAIYALALTRVRCTGVTAVPDAPCPIYTTT